MQDNETNSQLENSYQELYFNSGENPKLTVNPWKAFIFVAVLSAICYQYMVWGHKFISANFVQVKVILNVESTEDLVMLSTLCFEQKNYLCAAELNEKLIKKDDENKFKYAETSGNIYYNLGKFNKAQKIFKDYEQAGGEDSKALYQYAQSLRKLKMYDQSLAVFSKILKLKPNKLQVTVLKTYISTLVDLKNYGQASQVIKAYRKKSTTTDLYLKDEIELLKGKI